MFKSFVKGAIIALVALLSLTIGFALSYYTTINQPKNNSIMFRHYTINEISIAEYGAIKHVSGLIRQRNHTGIEKERSIYKAYLLIDAANREGLCPALLVAVAQVESDFTHHTTRNHANAIGIMQLTPIIENKYGINGSNLEENIQTGAKFISHLVDRYDGDYELVLNHYVGGSYRYVKEVLDVWDGISKALYSG